MSTVMEVAQALAMIAVVPSLIFVGVQTRHLVGQARASDRSSAHDATHSAVTLVSQFEFYLVDHPELIGYFNRNEPVPQAEIVRRRVLLLAGIWADAIEYGLMTKDMEKLARPYAGWHNYATKALTSSPALRQRMTEDPQMRPRLTKHAEP